MQVFDAFAPQEGARHLQRLALQLEEVEQGHQQRDEEQKDGGPGRQRVVVAEVEFLLQPAVGGVLEAEQAQRQQHRSGQGHQEQKRQRPEGTTSLCGYADEIGENGPWPAAPGFGVRRFIGAIVSLFRLWRATVLGSAADVSLFLCASGAEKREKPPNKSGRAKHCRTPETKPSRRRSCAPPIIVSDRVAAGRSAPGGRTAPGCW